MTEGNLHPEALALLSTLRTTYVTEKRRMALYMAKESARTHVQNKENPTQADLDKVKAFEIAIDELRAVGLIEGE